MDFTKRVLAPFVAVTLLIAVLAVPGMAEMTDGKWTVIASAAIALDTPVGYVVGFSILIDIYWNIVPPPYPDETSLVDGIHILETAELEPISICDPTGDEIDLDWPMFLEVREALYQAVISLLQNHRAVGNALYKADYAQRLGDEELAERHNTTVPLLTERRSQSAMNLGLIMGDYIASLSDDSREFAVTVPSEEVLERAVSVLSEEHPDHAAIRWALDLLQMSESEKRLIAERLMEASSAILRETLDECGCESGVVDMRRLYLYLARELELTASE